jgi:hypothetical protein
LCEKTRPFSRFLVRSKFLLIFQYFYNLFSLGSLQILLEEQYQQVLSERNVGVMKKNFSKLAPKIRKAEKNLRDKVINVEGFLLYLTSQE